MVEEKKLYILIEYCCHHFNGLYTEDQLPELAEDWFGDENFKFDTVENLSEKFNKIGYGLNRYII